MALAIEQYLALVEDLETVCCFLDFQETNEHTEPLNDFQVSGHDA